MSGEIIIDAGKKEEKKLTCLHCALDFAFYQWLLDNNCILKNTPYETYKKAEINCDPRIVVQKIAEFISEKLIETDTDSNGAPLRFYISVFAQLYNEKAEKDILIHQQGMTKQ